MTRRLLWLRSYEFLDMIAILGRNVCLSPSAKAIAQRNALCKSAVTRGANSPPVTLTQYPECDCRMLWMIYFEWSLFISRVNAVVIYGMNELTKNILFASTFEVASNFCRLRALDAGGRRPRFRTENCDASRHDDDTTSSTLHASIRKTVRCQRAKRHAALSKIRLRGGREGEVSNGKGTRERYENGRKRRITATHDSRMWTAGRALFPTLNEQSAFPLLLRQPIVVLLPLRLYPASSIRLAW